MSRPAAFAALFVLWLPGPRAGAFTVHSVQASFAAPTYHVSLVAQLEARPEDVEAVLVDYRNYRRLDPRIRASEVLSGALDATVVRTPVRFCAAFFCRTIDRVETVQHLTGELVATVDPDLSELRSGLSRTTWRAQDGGTIVVYEAEFAPAFWVPEIIARRFAAPALRDATMKLFANVEREANARRK